MSKQQLLFGEKTEEYPYGYGYCQCGCKAKTYEYLPDSYRRFMSLHRHSRPNKWLPDPSEIQSKAEIRRKEKEVLDNKLENIPKHEAPDKIKHIFDYYGMEPKDTPEASQALNDGAAFIYIIRCESFIKIGISQNVEQRLQMLQIGNPLELQLLKKFTSYEPSYDEKILHNMFVPYHVRGEWFQLPSHIIEKLLKLEDLNEIDETF